MEFQLYTTTAKNLPLGNRNPRLVCLASNPKVDTQTKTMIAVFDYFR